MLRWGNCFHKKGKKKKSNLVFYYWSQVLQYNINQNFNKFQNLCNIKGKCWSHGKSCVWELLSKVLKSQEKLTPNKPHIHKRPTLQSSISLYHGFLFKYHGCTSQNSKDTEFSGERKPAWCCRLMQSRFWDQLFINYLNEGIRFVQITETEQRLSRVTPKSKETRITEGFQDFLNVVDDFNGMETQN